MVSSITPAPKVTHDNLSGKINEGLILGDRIDVATLCIVVVDTVRSLGRELLKYELVP
jgi:hypothetical protein